MCFFAFENNRDLYLMIFYCATYHDVLFGVVFGEFFAKLVMWTILKSLMDFCKLLNFDFMDENRVYGQIEMNLTVSEGNSVFFEIIGAHYHRFSRNFRLSGVFSPFYTWKKPKIPYVPPTFPVKNRKLIATDYYLS